MPASVIKAMDSLATQDKHTCTMVFTDYLGNTITHRKH
jgi:hypothetical protein